MRVDEEFNDIILKETLPSIMKAYHTLALTSNGNKLTDDNKLIKNVLDTKTPKLKLILNKFIDSQSALYSDIFKTE